MKGKKTNSAAISEVVSVILVIALVLVLAIAVYVLISGQLDPKYMQKSVYVAGNSAITGIPRSSGLPDNVLTFLPKAGDDFYLIGQKQGKGTPVTMKVLNSGRTIVPNASSLSGSLYGKTLYIYPTGICELNITDVAPKNYLPEMTTGLWKIQLIDEKVHVLADTYETDVKTGSTSVPKACCKNGLLGKCYRSDCSPMNQTYTGTLYSKNDGPGNLSYTHFNGASNLTIADDPTMSFNGDLSISVWIRPASPLTSGQIIGKGIQYSSTLEDKNYDLYQMSPGALYFEWEDSTTTPSTHYHIETNSTTVLSANQWANVALVITGTPRRPSIYVNGVVQPISYYKSNQQGVGKITDPALIPAVNLKNNNNPVSIGAQNTDITANKFYYSGDIGELSLYNRPLTTQEISDNFKYNLSTCT